MEERAWVESYEKELDPKKRREILDAAIEAEGLTPANELRRKLLEARYDTVKGQHVDRFIRGWMEMQFIKGSRTLFGKRGAEKEKERLREDLGLVLAEPYGEEGRQVLYEEFCNGARLFLKLCREDRSYSSLLFGLGRMKESSLTSKLARTFYTAAVEAPQRIGMAEELQEFRRALVDVFREAYPEESAQLTAHVPE